MKKPEAKSEQPEAKSNLSWNKFKDVMILSLLGLAIRIFHTNMEDMNKSVQTLNEKVSVVISTTQTHDKEITILRDQVRDLEIAAGPRLRKSP